MLDRLGWVVGGEQAAQETGSTASTMVDVAFGCGMCRGRAGGVSADGFAGVSSGAAGMMEQP